jgi:hypothetical protein
VEAVEASRAETAAQLVERCSVQLQPPFANDFVRLLIGTGLPAACPSHGILLHTYAQLLGKALGLADNATLEALWVPLVLAVDDAALLPPELQPYKLLVEAFQVERYDAVALDFDGALVLRAAVGAV